MVDLRKGLVCSCAFVGTLASNAVLPLIPGLREAFNATTSEILLSITFFMFFFAFFSLFTGAISDIIGRKRILIAGLLTYSLGCALTAYAVDLNIFYLSRVVQGLGFAFVQPVLMAILGDIATNNEVGRTMGWMTAATMGGITLGPLVAGLASTYDWRIAFGGIALFSTALALMLIYLLDERQAHDKPASNSLSRNLTVALRRKGVQMLALTGFLQVMVWTGTQAFTSDRLGTSPYFASAGLIGAVLATAGISSVLVSRFGGGLVDKFGRFRTVLLGNLLMALSLLIMATIMPDISTYTILLAVFAIGSAISWAGQLTLAMEVCPSLKGTVSSIFTSFSFTGGAVSVIVLSPVQYQFGTACVYAVGATMCGIMCITALAVVSDIRRAAI